MNRFYLLRKENPEAAKRALQVILKQDPNDAAALQELITVYLKENKPQLAKPLAQRLRQLQEGVSPAKSVVASVKQKTPATASDRPSVVLGILSQQYADARKKDEAQAEGLLSVVNKIAPDIAYYHSELGYAYLRKKEEKEAIAHFLYAYQLKPNPRLALQLGYLYMNQGDTQSAAQYFLLASQSPDKALAQNARAAYAYAQYKPPSVEAAPLSVPTKPLPRDEALLNAFYNTLKVDKNKAWQLIQSFVAEYPDHLTALKEAAYMAIDRQETPLAIHYFTRAYKISYEDSLAMQLGYLYDKIDDKNIAYRYFSEAGKSDDKALALRANNAMTNLAGQQTKFYPKPYFGEVFFDPFSQTRFGLTVRPLIMRLGIAYENELNSRLYTFLRQTDDNKSRNAGQLSQIFEDNVRITGLGYQITPLHSVPLVFFAEAGAAYDLVYRDRNRWRGDLRGGFMYYNEFGAKPAYYDKPQFNMDYYSILYADATYFSRYQNNVIATVKTHQGVRLFQHQSTMINLYVTGRVIEDTNREFFNNIAEVGPGISWTPSNRYRIQLRFEHINGVYLPVGGSFNPYGKYYTNNTIQLFYYIRL